MNSNHAYAVNLASKAIAAALLIVACTHARSADLIVTRDGLTDIAGVNRSVHPDNASVLTFSSAFIGFLNKTTSWADAATAPSTLHVELTPRLQTLSVQWHMPVDTIALRASSNTATDPDGFHASGFAHAGELRFFSEDGMTGAGGHLQLSKLRVDLESKQIFGDLHGQDGQHGTNVALWAFDTATTPLLTGTSPCALGDPTCERGLAVTTTLTGLRIEPEAFELFAKSLRLSDTGRVALMQVQDYGSLVTAVPEPASWLLMGLGLVGIGAASRRTRAN